MEICLFVFKKYNEEKKIGAQLNKLDILLLGTYFSSAAGEVFNKFWACIWNTYVNLFFVQLLVIWALLKC